MCNDGIVEESTVSEVDMLEYAEHALSFERCVLESKSLASVLRTKLFGLRIFASLLTAFDLPAKPVAAVGPAVKSTEAVIDLLREGDGVSRQLNGLFELTFTKSDTAEHSVCTLCRMLGSAKDEKDTFTYLGDVNEPHPIETVSHEIAQLIGGYEQLNPTQCVDLLAMVTVYALFTLRVRHTTYKQKVLEWFNNENLLPTDNLAILAVRAGG